MSRYITTSKSYPCPICQKTNGNCRTFDDSDLVLCMSHQDDDYRHIGYKYTKQSKNGLWGIYVPLEEQLDYSNTRKEAYYQAKKTREKAKLEALKDTLSINDRDHNIRLLHKHLGLLRKDREKLQHRGLTDEAIDRGLFFSIEGYEQIPEFIDYKLPGVFIGKNGKPTLVGDKNGSIACVAFKGNKAIGWQYRHSREENKYTWAKGIKSSHLCNGELPITHLKAHQKSATSEVIDLETKNELDSQPPVCAVHDDRVAAAEADRTLWVTEGILKPYIVHSKFNLNIIGASGFNFNGSQKQVSEIIGKYSYQNIVIALDAGAITNRHVMRQLERNINLFESNKCKIKIAWWGQVSKNNLDLDELSSFDNIQLIDLAQFYSLPEFKKNGYTKTHEAKKDDYLNYSYSLEQFKKDLDNHEFSLFQESLIIQVNRLSRSFKKSFWDQKLIIPNLQPSKYTYHLDRPLPSPIDYIGNPPLIIIPTKYKDIVHSVTTELINLGWKHIHNSSQTGSGKSQSIAKLDKVIYLDTNYHNPSIDTIEQFRVMIPRTRYGTYKYKGKVKVDPTEEIRNRAKQLEKGNCHLKDAFRILEAKGYQAELENLPCKSCQHKNYCGSVDYLFKGARKNAIKEMVESGKGRMHPSQLTEELLRNSFDDFTLVWEEAGNLKQIKNTTFTKDNINSAIVRLTQIKTIDRTKIEQLIEVLIELGSITNYEIAKKLTDTRKYYGLEQSTIFDNLPQIPDFNTDELIELLTYFNNDIELPSLIDPIGGETIDKKYRQQFKTAEKYLRKELQQELEDVLASVSPNLNLLFTALLTRNKNLNISITKQGYLLLSQLNGSHRVLASCAKANLYLDATATDQQIKGAFCIPQDEPLITIKIETIALNNIQIFNINTKGLKSGDWSDTALKRTATLIKTIKNQNKDKSIAIICPKTYVEELETNYYYGRDDRGSNELKDYDAIIFVGTPNVNLGDAKREYELVYGDGCGFTFEQYYNQLLRENRLQGTGRHRGQWQLGKQLTQYYIATDEDLSYFSDLGMQITNLEAQIVNPECGDRTEQSLFKIRSTVVALIKSGLKVTQKSVAEALNITRDSVSHMMRGFEGGWKAFKKCVVSLIDTYKGKLHKTSGDDFISIGWRENPSEIALTTFEVINEHGFDEFLEAIRDCGTPMTIALEIMWTLACTWDERFNQHFWQKLLITPNQ